MQFVHSWFYDNASTHAKTCSKLYHTCAIRYKMDSNREDVTINLIYSFVISIIPALMLQQVYFNTCSFQEKFSSHFFFHSKPYAIVNFNAQVLLLHGDSAKNIVQYFRWL